LKEKIIVHTENNIKTINIFCEQNAELLIVKAGDRSRVSSGSIVSDYGLDDRGSIPSRGKGFFL
jgi:hypothetical protein